MSGLCKLFNIEYRQSRVCDGLSEDSAGVLLKCRVQFLFTAIRGNEGGGDAHFCQSDGDQVKRSAINRGRSNDVASTLTDVKKGKEVCCLSGGCQHSRSTALESSDFGSDVVICRIL